MDYYAPTKNEEADEDHWQVCYTLLCKANYRTVCTE